MNDGDIRVERDVALLAAALGGSALGGDVVAHNVRVRQRLAVADVHCEQVRVDKGRFAGDVVLTRCRFASLFLRGLMVGGSLILEDCDVGRCDVRAAPGRLRISGVRSRFDEVVIHGASGTVLTEVRVSGTLRLSEPSGTIDICDLVAGRVGIDASTQGNLDELEMSQALVDGTISLSGITVGRAHFRDVETGGFVLNRMRTNRLQVEDLRTGALGARITDIGATADSSAEVSVSGFCQGSTRITASATLEGDRIHATFEQYSCGGDFVAGGPLSIQLKGSGVSGRVGFVEGRAEPRLLVVDSILLGGLQVPSRPIRTPSDARELARHLLGDDGASQLSLVRQSLTDRPDEQDVVYFAQRVQEARGSTGMRRLAALVGGSLFGWGVLFGPPLRTLAAGILLTALAVGVAGPNESGITWLRMWHALIGATALWFNVSLGLPAGMNGTGWAVAAVVCTACGLTIITVLIGIAIRKLTR